MAGQSEKKKAKMNAEYFQLWNTILTAINGVFILYRVLWHWSSMDMYAWAGYACTCVTMVGCWVRIKSLRVSLGPSRWKNSEGKSVFETEFDIMCLAMLVQVLSMFSAYAYLLFLILPLALIYMGVQKCLSWVFTPTESEMMEEQEMSERELRRQAKKDKKRARGRVSFGRR